MNVILNITFTLYGLHRCEKKHFGFVTGGVETQKQIEVYEINVYVITIKMSGCCDVQQSG